MARAIDLIGLGEHPFMARRVGTDPVSLLSSGTTAGSATQIPPFQSVVFCNASAAVAGSGLLLPAIGGDPGCLLGDIIQVVNLQAGTIAIYAANNAQGSVVSLVGNGAAVTGTTGVSLVGNHAAFFQSVTISTWLLVKTSA